MPPKKNGSATSSARSGSSAKSSGDCDCSGAVRKGIWIAKNLMDKFDYKKATIRELYPVASRLGYGGGVNRARKDEMIAFMETKTDKQIQDAYKKYKESRK